MCHFMLNPSKRLYKESTSKGNQVKWVSKSSKDGVLYIKADSLGYEGISEALVGELLGYVSGISYVDYWLCPIEENGVHYNGCYSENMLNEGEDLISIYRLLKCGGYTAKGELNKYKGKELVEYVCNGVFELTGCDIKEYLGGLMLVDWITLNEDRHLNNISLIRSDGCFKPSPIFDNGLSLCSDVRAYPLEEPISRSMMRVKSKPFSTSFEKQCGYFDVEPLRIRYDDFCKELENCTVPYGMREYSRAKAILLNNLKRLEGIAWVRE